MIHYPKIRKETVEEKFHGETIEDPYCWLENNDSQNVEEWNEKLLPFIILLSSYSLVVKKPDYVDNNYMYVIIKQVTKTIIN